MSQAGYPIARTARRAVLDRLPDVATTVAAARPIAVHWIVVVGCAAGITVQLGGSILAGAANP